MAGIEAVCAVGTSVSAGGVAVGSGFRGIIPGSRQEVKRTLPRAVMSNSLNLITLIRRLLSALPINNPPRNVIFTVGPVLLNG
jgi:hypothetical protein